MKLHRLLSECLTITYTQNGDSANYAIKKRDSALYIFFEKSNGEADWEVNLDFPAKSYKRMGQHVWFAHRGFLELWKRTEPYLADAVLDKSVKRAVITGYSHGGAMATLCHEYVWYHRPDLRPTLEGYGFGSPRVLWGTLSAEVRARFDGFTVVRNIDDAVTHLPPSALGYHHVGTLLEIGKRGKYSAADAHRAENILAELKLYELKNT